MNMENVRPARAFPVIAVLALLIFQVGTVAAQPNPDPPSGDSLNRPPASSELAFVREGQIYLVNVDGSGLIQLTDTEPGIENRDPAWSRDGQRLAFARDSLVGGIYEIADIYIMDADGSNVVQVTHEGYNIEPAWGPDDHTIAFSSLPFSGAGMGVSVIDVDAEESQGSRILIDDFGWAAQPAWSPDGQTITFSSDYEADNSRTHLYAMNADGSNVGVILAEPPWDYADLSFLQSAWSPDGRNIAVVRCPGALDLCYPDSAITVVNFDEPALRAMVEAGGLELREIIQAGGYASPTWSPDGQWIAYSSSQCRDCQSSIRFVHVDGGIEGLIVEDGHSPTWRLGGGSQIDEGHSGAWYNPATSAQGQFIDVNPDSQFVFLGWPTFTADDTDNPNEQQWFTASGEFHGNRAELTVYESTGGQFDSSRAVTTNPVGELSLTLFNCDQGAIDYRLDDGDLEGSFPINRAIPDASNLCEQQIGSITLDQPLNPGRDGLWIDVTTSGQGFFFDVHANEAGNRFMFASWLTYGDNTVSGQRWLTAQGQFEGSSVDLVMYESSGGSFNSAKPAATVAVGTMSITFTGCNNAMLSYSLPGEGINGTSALQRAIPVGDNDCEELNTTR